MTVIALSDKLQNGKGYTFRFQANQIFVPRASDIAAHLERAYAFLSGVQASRAFTSDLYDVSFTWKGVPTVAGDVSNNMVQILASDGAFLFVSGQSGIAASALPGLLGIPGLPSLQVIVLVIAAVVLIAVFAGSFGKGLAARI